MHTEREPSTRVKTKHKMSIHFVGRIEVESKGKGEKGTLQ